MFNLPESGSDGNTNRCWVEAALRESERSLKLFRSLVNLSSDAVYVIEPSSSRFLDVNHVACDRLGYTRDEILKLGVIDIEDILPDHDSWLRHVEQVRGEGSLLLEGVHRCKDGCTIPVEINVRHVTVDDQDYMIAVVRDIRERKQVDEALRASQEQYRRMLESLPLGVVIHDGRTMFYANSQAAEIAGCQSAEELLRWTPMDLVAPAYRQLAADRIETILRTGDVLPPVECQIQRSDGTVVDVEVRSIKTHFAGHDCVQVHFYDITARKQAEEVLRTHSQVLNSMAEGVSFIDEHGIIIYANRALNELFGYAEGELIGQRVTILNDATAVENTQIARRVHEGIRRQGRWHGEFRNRRKDGTVFYTRVNIVPVEQPGRAFWVSVQQDITAARQAELQVARLRDELAHVARVGAVGELAAGIAHEINQPLAAIANFAYALRVGWENLSSAPSPTLTFDPITLSRNLQEQAVRAGDIIRRLQGLIRKQPPIREAVSVSALVGEVLSLLRSEIQEAEIEVETEIPESLAAPLVDPIQIQQVLFNLCRNSIEALRSQPSNRRLLIAASMAESSRVALIVRDTGPGIAEHVQHDLCSAFVTTKPHGLGLGLAISRRIVEAHGGQLIIRSARDAGTEIEISLTCAELSRVE